jgi:microcystin-dependent protein
MSKLAWLTGDSLPASTKDIVFTVPNDNHFLSLIKGALVPLIYSENFEKIGTLTPDQCADYLRPIILKFFEEIPAMIPGLIMAWPKNTAPTGWLLCDGSSYSVNTYNALYQVIGMTFGGDLITGQTFQVPNIKGKVIVGRDPSDSAFDVLGEIGGAKTHTLSEAQLPGHSHTNPYFYGLGATGPYFFAGNPSGSTVVGPPNNPTGVTGGNQPHNNLQPYIVMPYIIKF